MGTPRSGWGRVGLDNGEKTGSFWRAWFFKRAAKPSLGSSQNFATIRVKPRYKCYLKAPNSTVSAPETPGSLPQVPPL